MADTSPFYVLTEYHHVAIYPKKEHGEVLLCTKEQPWWKPINADVWHLDIDIWETHNWRFRRYTCRNCGHAWVVELTNHGWEAHHVLMEIPT